ncbi:MAG: EAL domain-containing protein [Deltaproteobacteria bacterium]|nr:EAL domain-containing protein [Deltaproteobacteria bacterium]
MSTNQLRILVVDDEPVVHAVIEEALRAPGRELLFASSVGDAGQIIKANTTIDVALLDKNLPDGSGFDVGRQLKERDPEVEVILMTGFATVDSAVDAVKLGVFDYVTKPFDDINRLVLQVQNAGEKVRLKREHRRLVARLLDSEQRYTLATLGANDGLWDWDLLTEQMYFAPRWKDIVGCSDVEIGSSPEEWFSRIHPEDAVRVRSLIRTHIDGHLPQFKDEHRMLHKDGTYRWVLVRGVATRDSTGRAVRMAGSQTDITESRLAEQQMQYDALHDAVTFLPNRVLFLDRLGQAVARARRRTDYRFAVVLLDLDRFKIVNDSLGHTSGDELLGAAARRLETCMRAGDTAARLGGDEFALLLDDLRNLEDAVHVADRIQTELAKPLNISGKEVFVTSSIGIAVSNQTYSRPEDLLRDADIAMYRAKAQGKARHVVFDPAMQGRPVRLLELDTALRRAIERREFLLHYQPIIALDGGRIVGFEALVRWQHPERGMVGPGEFIPVAEETGLIIPISRLVLEDASRQVRAWQAHFPALPPLYVSVNISTRHLMFPGLVEDVSRVMRESAALPNGLRLEITESAVMENAETAAGVLEALKGLKVQIYMDDFGTGYSSLSYLHRLPIDSVKIDRSFVSSLGKEGENSVIVHTIITLARALGMEVIAEGVETADQLLQLRALKCDHAQGFFFAKPMAPDAASALLERHPTW